MMLVAQYMLWQAAGKHNVQVIYDGECLQHAVYCQLNVCR